jgi:hypothetical protein
LSPDRHSAGFRGWKGLKRFALALRQGVLIFT